MSDLNSFLVEDDNDKTEWFAKTPFLGKERWHIYGGSMGCIVLNPAFPDSVDLLSQSFPLLPALVESYIAIDRLNSTETRKCLTSIEAIDYIIHFNRARKTNDYDTINNWREYMLHIDEEIIYAPDFTLWDKHTREIEELAQAAINQSKKIIDEHNRPEKRLPKEVSYGILVRTRLLREWATKRLEPIRAREDYKIWKTQKDTPPQPPQIRRRRGAHGHAASNMILTTPSMSSETSQRHERRSKLQLMQQYLQEDLTIWSLNLAIYISCTIIQAISFFTQLPTNLSTSDYLNAIQTTLTQLLSILMTYVLTSRNASDYHLISSYRFWFILAGFLPVVGAGVVKWYSGLSALLMFLGTVVTGFLQVLLAVDMKGSKVLP